MRGRNVRQAGRPVYGSRLPNRPKRKGPSPMSGKAMRNLGIILILLVVLFNLFSYFSIETVKVSGTSTLNAESVSNTAQGLLRSQFGGGNLLTIRAGRFKQELSEKIPEIKSVSLKRHWPKDLQLVISERQASLVWETGGESYLLDSEGVVIKKVETADRLRVVDASNLPVTAGDRVAPRRFIDFVGQLAQELPRTGLHLQELVIRESTSEVAARVGEGYEIRLDTTRELGPQLADLRTVLGELNRQGRRPAEYIDLRIPSKAYFK